MLKDSSFMSVIKGHSSSLKPSTVYLTLGIINIQWGFHGSVKINSLQLMRETTSGSDHTESFFTAIHHFLLTAWKLLEWGFYRLRANYLFSNDCSVVLCVSF